MQTTGILLYHYTFRTLGLEFHRTLASEQERATLQMDLNLICLCLRAVDRSSRVAGTLHLVQT